MTEGREKDITEEAREAIQSGQLADDEIEKKIAEDEGGPPQPGDFKAI